MNDNSPRTANGKIFAATTQGLFPLTADGLKIRRLRRFLYPVKQHQSHYTSLLEESLRRQAKAKAAAGNYSAAIDILTAAIAIHPQNAINYNNRGLIYFQSGQQQKALADYTKALQLNPQLSEAYNNRANYYAAHQQLEMALSDYDQAIDLNPFNIRAWINRGITYRHLGMYDLSLDNLDFALRMGRLEAQIYAERGRTYHLMGDWNCAIADYQSSLAKLNSPANSPDLSGTVARQSRRVEAWLNDLLQPLLT
ncbi:MAG: tetratricopeptide repeat protein [Hormoscilla sp.]